MRTKQAFPGQEGAGLNRLEWFAGMVVGGLAAGDYSVENIVRIAFNVAQQMEVEADRIQNERSQVDG